MLRWLAGWLCRDIYEENKYLTRENERLRSENQTATRWKILAKTRGDDIDNLVCVQDDFRDKISEIESSLIEAKSAISLAIEACRSVDREFDADEPVEAPEESAKISRSSEMHPVSYGGGCPSWSSEWGDSKLPGLDPSWGIDWGTDNRPSFFPIPAEARSLEEQSKEAEEALRKSRECIEFWDKVWADFKEKQIDD